MECHGYKSLALLFRVVHVWDIWRKYHVDASVITTENASSWGQLATIYIQIYTVLKKVVLSIITNFFYLYTLFKLKKIWYTSTYSKMIVKSNYK